jgi:predicted exporter
MTIDIASITSNQIVLWGLIALAAIVVFVVIRFFWRHLLKYLFHGCFVILVIIALLAVLHFYFKVF